MSLRVIPLGGLGEVGLNLMVLEWDGEGILIDCGVLFPDLHWLGLDLVVPDFSYLEKLKKIHGIFLTHGHEDHIGALPFLMQKMKIPKVYCSRFTGRLLEHKCTEYGVDFDDHWQQINRGSKVQAGPFEVEFIHVTHSTIESFALAIRTPAGLVVHSGDFKFDPTPYRGDPTDKARFAELGKENPLLLLSDSTNSECSGHSRSESFIHNNIRSLVEQTPGAVVVALFASNIHRVHQLFDIAKETNRFVFLSGRSMERYIQVALEEGYLPIDLKRLRPLEEMDRYRREEIMMLSTGSQGEARSSLLRLSRNENRFLKIQQGDAIIMSSRNIPGNEKAVFYVINHLFKLGAQVYYEDQHAVHASGHAHREEQLELINLIKPRFFIPIHGEYRHLVAHAKTAQESQAVKDGVFILENGQVWEWESDSDSVKMTEVVDSGRKWYFNGTLGTFEDPPLRARKAAARSGVVSVVCALNARKTELLKTPFVSLSGFLCEDRVHEHLKVDISAEAQKAFENWHELNHEGLTREQAVAQAARRVVKRVIDTKPLVIVQFIILKS